MAYSPTDLATVLQAIVNRLIAEAGFTEDSCFLALSRPDSLPNTPGDPEGVWAIVYPGDAGFNQALMAGGGTEQTVVNWTIIVEVYSPIVLDMQARDGLFLTHSAKGIGQAILRVLKALTVVPLFADIDGTPNEITWEPMRPLGCGPPQRDDSLSVGSVAISFDVMFQWNLS